MSQITTHVLDTALGLPARGITITLFQQDEAGWKQLAAGVTNDDGRVPNFLPADLELPEGTYRMHFVLENYLNASNQPVFYPYADVVFSIDGNGEHYHIPLLLSPFGYSTYRGS